MTTSPVSIQVGTVAIAKCQSGVGNVGERGVYYEVYTLGSRPGYSFIHPAARLCYHSEDGVVASCLGPASSRYGHLQRRHLPGRMRPEVPRACSMCLPRRRESSHVARKPLATKPFMPRMATLLP